MLRLIPDHLWTDAGHGLQWVFFHNEVDSPAGIVERHNCPALSAEEAVRGGMVLFDTPYARGHYQQSTLWEVLSVEPLSINESIMCLGCGLHGFITNNMWEPIE
ncbi:hypothetical protein [Rhodococcus koreensis]